MAKSREQMHREIIVGMRKAGLGQNFDKGVTMDVSPTLVQSTEEKIRQTYEFLGMISSTPTDQDSGEILSLAEGQSIGQRSVKTDKNHKRNPIPVGGLTGRRFQTLPLELDVIIDWETQLQWGAQSGDVFNLYREYIMRSRAMTRMRMMWWGQSENLAIPSDLDAYDMMQDLHKGVFQYMIENYPANVLGITVGGITPKGYDINPIKVGDGGDFSSMVDLVNYLKTTMIGRIYRNNPGIMAIAGDSLVVSDMNMVIANSGNDAMQRAATETLLGLDTIAKVKHITPDEYPERALMVTNPLNIEYKYQTQSVRRSIEDSADKMGLVDYQWQKIDHVIKEVKACAMVHPDAILLKNKSGEWVANSEQWFIDPVI